MNDVTNSSENGQSHPSQQIVTAAEDESTGNAQNGSTQELNEKLGESPKWTDKIMAIFTVVLALLTGVLAILAFLQWREMHSGGVDTHDLAVAAKAQADEAKAQVDKLSESLEKTDSLIRIASDQATATKGLAAEAKVSAGLTRDLARTARMSLDTAQHSAQLEERAWIGVQALELTQFEAGKNIRARVSISNAGKSPAIAISYFANVVRLPTGKEPNFPYFEPPADRIGITSIPAQGSYEIQIADALRNSLTEDEKTRIDRETQIVWVYGVVHYEDVFRNDHITEFCGYTLDSVTKKAPQANAPLKSCMEYGSVD